MRRIAVCPGSFDPVTLGHLDIIQRASKLFDKVIVLISVNAAKKPSFSSTERVMMIQQVTKDLDNVVIDILDGLLADYVRDVGAIAIVKGLRAVSDFEYEFQMALANKKLYAGAETVFFDYHCGKYVSQLQCGEADCLLWRRYQSFCAGRDPRGYSGQADAGKRS